MTFYKPGKKYVEKNRVDHAIDAYAAKEKPTVSDLNSVRLMAQVEIRLEKYRSDAAGMSVGELEEERHQSKVLAEFMAVSGKPKPHSLCHAHAIISGAHKYAAELRAVMAWLQMRIDDPHNGCWLPKNTAAKAQMPKYLTNAIPHSRIHRFNYYFWLNRVINPFNTDSQRKLIDALKMIATRLQSGKQPTYVMNKKGIGLPA